MPAILQSRLAVAALLGVFLIPIAMSSLRGLTHVLSCEQAVESPFTVVVEDDGRAVVASSTGVVAGEDPGLCGGLDVILQARPEERGRLVMTVDIFNRTDHPWQGTVNLTLNGTSIPVSIGRVAAGANEEDRLVFRLRPGSHELEGSLLIGP